MNSDLITRWKRLIFNQCPNCYYWTAHRSLEESGYICELNCNDSSMYIRGLQCDLHDAFVEIVSPFVWWLRETQLCNHFSILCPVKMHSLHALVAKKLSLLLNLQGMAGVIGVSSFFLAFFIVSWYSSSVGPMKYFPLSWALSNLGFCQLPIFVFLDSERLSQFWTILQATHDHVWKSFERLSVFRQTM